MRLGVGGGGGDAHPGLTLPFHGLDPLGLTRRASAASSAPCASGGGLEPGQTARQRDLETEALGLNRWPPDPKS